LKYGEQFVLLLTSQSQARVNAVERKYAANDIFHTINLVLQDDHQTLNENV